ncbi:MAG: ribonuclease HII [Clostridia bacterium]|nr:ribonuclease HII [Clostridia bacterium]
MNSGAASWAASRWKRRGKKEGISLKKNSLTEEKRRIRLQSLTEIDAPLWGAGVRFAGMDEAGRGPLAGNVVAACVVMPREPLLLWVDDSKQLSAKRREETYEAILKTAVFVGVGQASPEEIDRYNILEATKMAMRRAAQGAPADVFLIDALSGLGLPGEERGIIHGDALSYSIAASSIIAKVTRDRQMLELDALYPGYGFAQHKGYGTAQHIAALKEMGPCPAHRRSFIGHFV